MENYFLTEREEQGRQTIGEWFQGLAERFGDVESVKEPVPAHVEHRNWKPRK